MFGLSPSRSTNAASASDSSSSSGSSNSVSSSNSRKVLIFDWDDTICPSTFVDKYKVDRFSDLPIHIQNLFNEIGRVAEKCLAEAARHGDVIIITNSDEGWVQYSAERYVPHLLPILPDYKVVSARTRYERFYPGQPLCWKAAAFAHEVNEIFSSHASDNDADVDDNESMDGACSSSDDEMNESMASTDESSSEDDDSSGDEAERSRRISRTSSSKIQPKSSKSKPPSRRSSSTNKKPLKEVISFGDSMEERTAVKIVSRQLSSMPKSVMFLQSPTPVQLIGQLSMVTDHMAFVCGNERSLDLEIGPEQARKSADVHLRNVGRTELLRPAEMSSSSSSSPTRSATKVR